MEEFKHMRIHEVLDIFGFEATAIILLMTNPDTTSMQKETGRGKNRLELERYGRYIRRVHQMPRGKLGVLEGLEPLLKEGFSVSDLVALEPFLRQAVPYLKGLDKLAQFPRLHPLVHEKAVPKTQMHLEALHPLQNTHGWLFHLIVTEARKAFKAHGLDVQGFELHLQKLQTEPVDGK